MFVLNKQGICLAFHYLSILADKKVGLNVSII